jgi:hypothetical protein
MYAAAATKDAENLGNAYVWLPKSKETCEFLKFCLSLYRSNLCQLRVSSSETFRLRGLPLAAAGEDQERMHLAQRREWRR